MPGPLYGLITETTKDALANNPRGFVTLECCANDFKYTKPDMAKSFLMIDSRHIQDFQERFEIYPKDLRRFQEQHPHLHDCLVNPEAFKNEGSDNEITTIRIPLNIWDKTNWGQFDIISQKLPDDAKDLVAYHTASRSCLALFPARFTDFPQRTDDWPVTPRDKKEAGKDNDGKEYRILVDVALWGKFKKILANKPSKDDPKRFMALGVKLSQAASQAGVASNVYGASGNVRIYSLKTGATFIGQMEEPIKETLEKNAVLAMNRSALMQTSPPGDPSFALQTEVFTLLDRGIENRAQKGSTNLSFQIRDLSCFKKAYHYLPAHTIPYVPDGFWHASVPEQLESGDVGEKVDFWVNNFSRPLGRAKAALFLRYGLFHATANAQNFVLGFDQQNRLRHFIMRDIGDTHWHDAYIEHIGTSANGAPQKQCLLDELANEDMAQTLELPATAGPYGTLGPKMLRLTPDAIIKHGFDTLVKNAGADREPLLKLKLAAGVLDGFRSFIFEMFDVPLFWGTEYAVDKMIYDKMCTPEYVQKVRDGSYPTHTDKYAAYQNSVTFFKGKSFDELMQMANIIRSWRATFLEFLLKQRSNFAIEDTVQFEEICLCLATEKLIARKDLNVYWGKLGETCRVVPER